MQIKLLSIRRGGIILPPKRLHHPVKNPVHVSQRHTIVANRNVLVDEEISAVEELFACAHATATLDSHGILFGMLNRRKTRHILEMDVLARVFQNHSRQLHTTDVLAGAMMGAGFKQQDRIAVLQL